MKYLFSIIIFLYSDSKLIAQTIDEAIQTATKELAQRVVKKGKSKIAIADFINNAGNSDAVTKYITEQFEIDLINSNEIVQVMDRKHIKQLLSDNHLQSEGLINENTAKSSIDFIKVDGWVFGEIFSIGDKIKISVKIIDASSSLTYAAYSSPLIKNDIEKNMQVATEKQKEAYIDALNEPIKNECIRNNTGDYCFTNNTKYMLNVNLLERGKTTYGATISVASGQSQCIYSIHSNIYSYVIQSTENAILLSSMKYNAKGQIQVEKCKSKTFIIR